MNQGLNRPNNNGFKFSESPLNQNNLGAKLRHSQPLRPNTTSQRQSPKTSSIQRPASNKANNNQDWAAPDESSSTDWRSPEAAMRGSQNQQGQSHGGKKPRHKGYLYKQDDRPDAKRDRSHNSVLRGAAYALRHPLKHELGSVFKAGDLGISPKESKNQAGSSNDKAKDAAKYLAKKKAKKAIGKGVKKTASATKTPLLAGSSVWMLWRLGKTALFKGVNAILNKIPVLNDIVPMIKDTIGTIKGLAHGLGHLALGGLKAGGHLLGKAGMGVLHGLGHVVHAAGHAAAGLAHAAAHPLAAATSAVHAITGGAILSHLGASSVMKLGAVGIAGISLVGAGDYIMNGRSASPIGCAVQQIKQDVTDSISGTSGEWTKKGTKAYNIAKSTYAAAKAQGCDDKHAAAVTGNAAHESGAFAMGLHVHQMGGGPGVGIFQFNDPPKDMSPSGQVKAIFANAPGHKSSWEHSSGSISSLTNSFEEIFERGGIPDNGRRDRLANRAYAMFKGIGGKTSAADENDEAAADGSKGACSKGSGDDTSASDVVKFAERYLGLKYSLGGNSVPISEGKPKSEVNPTDCNKFAWAVERGSGHAVPDHMPGNCDDSIQRLHKYEVPASKAHAGSLVINHYHAMVMMTPWRGLKGTKLIQEGGGGNNVNEGHSYYWSMASYLGAKRYFFNIPKR